MFWKLNSFVGTFGLLLLIAAFLAGDHAYSVLKPDHIIAAIWVVRTNQVLWLVYAAAFCLLWQAAMTGVGLLTSFFYDTGN